VTQLQIANADDVQTSLQALRERAARELYRADRVIAGVRAAASRLLHASTQLARDLRAQLQTETGLSLPMIEWGLTTSLTSLLNAPLPKLVRALPPQPVPGEVIGVVLAGNVFSAGMRAVSLPLLAGAHVAVKAASAESAWVRAFWQALCEADEDVGARLRVLSFSRDDAAAARALCSQVDVLSIYGDDTTVAELSEWAAPDCRVIPHGHGISAAFVSREQLKTSTTALRTAEALALDVAAYEQRGCLSPQFVYVESGAEVSPQTFAQLLSDLALPKIARLLPAATPTLEQRAARMQWQAAAAVRGDVYAHEHHAVSFEAGHSPRPSPGGRLVSVHACAGVSKLGRLLAPFEQHLKCVGVAGSNELRAVAAEQVSHVSSAYVTRLGEMQTPAFDVMADGRPAFAGLVPDAGTQTGVRLR